MSLNKPLSQRGIQNNLHLLLKIVIMILWYYGQIKQISDKNHQYSNKNKGNTTQQKSRKNRKVRTGKAG